MRGFSPAVCLIIDARLLSILLFSTSELCEMFGLSEFELSRIIPFSFNRS